MRIYCVTYAGRTGVVKCFKNKERAKEYAHKRGKAENVPFDYSVEETVVE